MVTLKHQVIIHQKSLKQDLVILSQDNIVTGPLIKPRKKRFNNIIYKTTKVLGGILYDIEFSGQKR